MLIVRGEICSAYSDDFPYRRKPVSSSQWYLISRKAGNIFGAIIIGQLREFKRGVEPPLNKNKYPFPVREGVGVRSLWALNNYERKNNWLRNSTINYYY
jgi:hypothetical protein